MVCSGTGTTGPIALPPRSLTASIPRPSPEGVPGRRPVVLCPYASRGGRQGPTCIVCGRTDPESSLSVPLLTGFLDPSSVPSPLPKFGPYPGALQLPRTPGERVGAQIPPPKCHKNTPAPFLLRRGGGGRQEVVTRAGSVKVGALRRGLFVPPSPPRGPAEGLRGGANFYAEEEPLSA